MEPIKVASAFLLTSHLPNDSIRSWSFLALHPCICERRSRLRDLERANGQASPHPDKHHYIPFDNLTWLWKMAQSQTNNTY